MKKPHIKMPDPQTMIGKQVRKHSGKPFKSGEKENTVKEVDGKCFLFVEDDSFVEIRQCEPGSNEIMQKLHTIIQKNKMSVRPAFYSGRGATLADLNGDILSGIHKGIQEELGPDAAKSFVCMVRDIKVLSATTFLNELYVLANNRWKYVKKDREAPGIDFEKDENGNHNLAQGLATIGAMMFGNDRDDTDHIRGRFLMNNGILPKRPFMTRDGMTVEYHY
jgi:hypothetical protein